MIFTKKYIRRIVAAFSALVAISAITIVPAFATEEPTDHGQQYAIVTASTLNVREYASMDAPILETLSMGSSVNVHWTETDWVCIDYNGSGSRAWISSEYVTICQGTKPEYSSTGGYGAVEVVKQFLGVPYVYGGTSPKGFDCSGLMQYVYSSLGYKINRVAADQMKNGVAIAREDMTPGDLVGFYSSPGSGYVSHIGMYVGDGMMIHAPHTGDVVRYASIDGTYYGARFAGARRIIY